MSGSVASGSSPRNRPRRRSIDGTSAVNGSSFEDDNASSVENVHPPALDIVGEELDGMVPDNGEGSDSGDMNKLLEEEMAMANEDKANSDQEYRRLLELVKKEITKSGAVSALVQHMIDDGDNEDQAAVEEVTDMLEAAKEDSWDLSTESEHNRVRALIKYVLGPRPDWCDIRSSEVKDFRQSLRKAYVEDWKKFGSKHPGVKLGEALRPLPPRYLMQPLPKQQAHMLREKCSRKALKTDKQKSTDGYVLGVLRVKCHYQDEGVQSITREARFDDAAEDFVFLAVERIKEVLDSRHLEPHRCILKVVGRDEYIYGDEPMINFRYIRTCIVKQLDINVEILRCPMPPEAMVVPRFSPTYELPKADQSFHDSCTLEQVYTSAAVIPERTEEVHRKSKHRSKGTKGPIVHLDPGSTMKETTAFSVESVVERRQAIRQSGAVIPLSQLSLWDIDAPLELTFLELRGIPVPTPERTRAEKLHEGDDVYVCLILELVFGSERLGAPQRTQWRACKAMVNNTSHQTFRVFWGRQAGAIAFPDVTMCNLPREARLNISLMAIGGEQFPTYQNHSAAQLIHETTRASRSSGVASYFLVGGKEDEDVVPFFMASGNFALFDHEGCMYIGEKQFFLWPGETKGNPISVCSTNPDKKAPCMTIRFPTFALPVVHPGVYGDRPSEHMGKDHSMDHHERMLKLDPSVRDNKIAQLRHVKGVVARDTLYNLTSTDKTLLWHYRTELIRKPRALGKFLLSAQWLFPSAVYQVHQLLLQWSRLEGMDALELLDARYADTMIRTYAVNCIRDMNDNDFHSVVLQLVQVLKYEVHHDSALARLLLERSLRSPHLIGHTVFWHLKAEMYNPQVAERHGLLIEEYLLRLPTRRSILRQHHVVHLLLNTAVRIKESKKDERLTDLRESLDGIVFPPSFTLALNGTMRCRGLKIDKCKVMDSKKLPLWLVFENADPLGDPIFVMFKAGDDLRQDLLTLQMLSLMDNVWKNAGLDLHMIPYGCVATGEGVGMIEIVLESDTVANITRREGGAEAAFKKEPLTNWLRNYNSGNTEVERMIWNFVFSCAGYCVATYILGIGDRHNDNIMLRKDGTMFHIDFGHFLGNFKSKFGFKRETAPFIFTPMYAHVMGGPGTEIYKYFTDVACVAFNCIRRYSNTLIVMFALMLSTGIPELQSVEDIEWLKTVLITGDSDETSATVFRQKIREAVENKRTLINDYIHIKAH